MSDIRVLAVNMQPLDCSLLDTLKETGFHVEQVQCLPDTAILLAQNPEVLLIEAISLPVTMLSGLKKSVTYSIIIILSSRDDLDLKIEYLNAGADAYFERPVSPPVMLAHLMSLLRRKMTLNPALSLSKPKPKKSFWQKTLGKRVKR